MRVIIARVTEAPNTGPRADTDLQSDEEGAGRRLEVIKCTELYEKRAYENLGLVGTALELC